MSKISIDWNDCEANLKWSVFAMNKALCEAVDEGNLALDMMDPAGEVTVRETVLRIAVLDKKLRILRARLGCADVAMKGGDPHYMGIILGWDVRDIQRCSALLETAEKEYEDYFASLPWHARERA